MRQRNQVNSALRASVVAAAGAVLAVSSPSQAQDAEDVFRSNLRSALEARQAQAATDTGAAAALSARNSVRIVGGREVTPSDDGAWEHSASLQLDGGHFCGATLARPITGVDLDGNLFLDGWRTDRPGPRIAITAAHCVFDENGSLLERERLSLRSGVLDLASAGGTVQTVVAIEPHPGFDVEGMLEHDIAVLVLSAPVSGDLGIARGVQMPTLLNALDYQRTTAGVSVNGWGRTADGGPFSDILRTAQIPYADQLACHDMHGRLGVDIPTSGFCAGLITGGVDSCQGDSGGGLVFQPRGATGAAIGDRLLTGVVSWGIGCARYGLQGIYTDVLRHVYWIEQVTTYYLAEINS